MPFPFVYRVPLDVDDETLLRLRVELVRLAVEHMHCPPEWVCPDFFRSSLPSPKSSAEGGSTVLLKLETRMFSAQIAAHPENTEEITQSANATLKALSDAIWEAFGRLYEVEASLTEWPLDIKYLVEAE